jgi:hypothetical protein
VFVKFQANLADAAYQFRETRFAESLLAESLLNGPSVRFIAQLPANSMPV